MAKHLKYYSPAGGNPTVEIPCETLSHSIMKDLQRFADSDGTNSWGDDNRYTQVVKVTGVVSRANMETLVAGIKTITGSTYPKIDVYNKSTADYYNTYTAVQFEALDCAMIGDDEWRVSCTFKW